jgi:UBX domain-containing protein 7
LFVIVHIDSILFALSLANFLIQMDISTEGRTYSERYGVHDYPHLAILDPRTGRLLWRKEGWTQEKPLTAEAFAEYAMDFCSRNSFDRPPSAPNSNGASARPVKRSMHEMSEDEQLEAAVKASLEKDDGEDDEEMEDSNDAMEGEETDAKPAASGELANNPASSALFADLQGVTVGEEPTEGARLQLKLPDGKRKVRKFAPTDTIRIIYAFLAVSIFEQHPMHLFQARSYVLLSSVLHRTAARNSRKWWYPSRVYFDGWFSTTGRLS